MSRGWNCFPSQTGRIAARETPRMATSGAFTMGVKAVPPMPPRLEIEKVPPARSSGASFPSRAFAASAASSRAISRTPFWSAFRSTGTTRPPGVSAANPTCQ